MREQDSYKFLKSLSDNTYTERELNHFIEKCTKIALFYLKKNHQRVSSIINAAGITFEDAAVEVVVRLLNKDSEGRYHNLIKSFNRWNPPVTNHEQAEFFINIITARCVDQYTAVLLKEKDRNFAKIHNAVKYLIKINPFTTRHYFGVKYITAEDVDEITSPVIDKETLFSLPEELFRDHKKMLGRIINYLEKETGFFPAIPFNGLIYKIKDRTLRLYQPVNTQSTAESGLIVEECVEESLSRIYQMMAGTYLETGKLRKYEYEKMKKVLADVAVDLKNGGIERGLYTYLKPYFKTLTNREYAARYRNITEYLVQTLKEYIADNLGSINSA